MDFVKIKSNLIEIDRWRDFHMVITKAYSALAQPFANAINYVMWILLRSVCHMKSLHCVMRTYDAIENTERRKRTYMHCSVNNWSMYRVNAFQRSMKKRQEWKSKKQKKKSTHTHTIVSLSKFTYFNRIAAYMRIDTHPPRTLSMMRAR